MPRRYLYRNIQARDHLEIFLVSAVSSLLLLRFYLHVTGYPQVGGGSLHIAHLLWGGVLMLAAIVISLSFLGVRSQRVSALVGGAGFGVFIDELGKFITKDNNYFFRPTIGLIYAIFCILYLTFDFISRRQHLSSEEYQLNALRQFEEAVLHDMDDAEKSNIRRLLARANQHSPITHELLSLLKHVETIPSTSSRWHRFRAWLSATYARFWRSRSSNRLVATVFVLQAITFLIAVIGSVFNNLDDIRALLHGADSYSTRLLIGQLLSSLVAAGFIVVGVLRLTTSRTEAYEFFRRAILINLFLTEFFIFSRIQFGAIPGFLLSLGLLLALRFAVYQERHSA